MRADHSVKHGGRVTSVLVAAILVVGVAALAASRTAGAAASWSVLYVANGNLWLTNGDRPRQLTQDGNSWQPALAADALAYVVRSDNSSDVWLANEDEGPHAITRNGSSVISYNHWVAQPTFDPSTATLYALSDRDKAATGVGDLAVWQLDATGTSAHQVTHPPEYTGGDQDVTINPLNGQQMIFTRYRYGASGELVEELDWLDRTSGQLVSLTPPDEASRQAAYAPDGSHVAFVRTVGATETLFVGRLDLSDGTAKLVDVSEVVRGVTAQPTWRPDGGALAYLALTKRRFEVWTIAVEPANGGGERFGSPRALTNDDDVDARSRPVWLPDETIASLERWLQTPTP